ncbi:MAG: sodium/proton-translocating pyrophosphatase [Planctomycetes bacterium]|nr:sodium/proton-translocating pyrophosphatase [Planctomycetota bacterium]
MSTADAAPAAMGDPSIPLLWYLAPICGFVALFMAWKYYKEVLASDEGDESMKVIAAHVREGAYAYLRRQYKVVAIVFVGMSLVLATQQPSALDTSAVSQSDLVFIHKLTIESDIQAATARMPARGPSSVTTGMHRANIAAMGDLLRVLDAGQSMVADSEADRGFLMQSRPRVTPHGGGEPDL